MTRLPVAIVAVAAAWTGLPGGLHAPEGRKGMRQECDRSATGVHLSDSNPLHIAHCTFHISDRTARSAHEMHTERLCLVLFMLSCAVA